DRPRPGEVRRHAGPVRGRGRRVTGPGTAPPPQPAHLDAGPPTPRLALTPCSRSETPLLLKWTERRFEPVRGGGPMADTVAKLALEDGTVYTGRGFGAPGETAGEVVFNTSMTGY